MKYLSEKQAVGILLKQKAGLTQEVVSNYEHKAKSCAACDTPGLCCTDEHFVNVHITRLEARQINLAINKFPEKLRQNINEKIDNTISSYGLTEDGASSTKTFSCPLFDRSAGCVVHNFGKPFPCIIHACYENKADLPPDELLRDHEKSADRLNKSVYGKEQLPLPLPIALAKFR